MISTFTSHLSRKHKKYSEESLLDSILEAPVNLDSNFNEAFERDQHFHMDCEPTTSSNMSGDHDVCSETADETLFMKNLALFCLKLQAKLLLPSSVIQTIIEDFQNVHDISQSHLLYKLNEKLVTIGVPEAEINNVIDVVKREDLFRACNTHVLKTDQRRKTVFKNSFHYVEPVPVCLGQNEEGKECFAQYVPIKTTIESLFLSESIREQHKQSHSQVQTEDVIKDVWDGKNITENLLFVSEASSLGLILYQDSFEVVNPLGSGKKKHKVLAVYLTLADILPHNRSSIDQMQLVLLCREQDFKFFGQELVMGQLVKDLKDLEVKGITLSGGQVRKGTLCAIAGDNLGSHNIGGFVENFSRSLHFCRYCEIDRQTFQSSPVSRGPNRTVQSYKDHLQSNVHVQNLPTAGIKFDSLFNELTYYHVCQPGLPPCLGHDLFEGVVAYDLALYIKHLVTKDKRFTYQELNRRINQFKYLGNDAHDKPCEVNPGSEKLGGHAVQNWCFLRLLPVLVGNKIESPAEDEVWQLVLQLRDIVEFVCAHAISTGQIAYLRVLIDDYLHFRMVTFSDSPLKPKHHYMSHYPELIVHFGPLIRLWTLRFESKHTYFKQCARKLHNFKNLCATLAERHQLLQAFLSAGNLFPPHVIVEKETEFFLNDYNDAIRDSVVHLNAQSTNTVVTHEVTVKGTKYRKNMFIVICRSDEGLIFGQIKLILIKADSVNFVTQNYQSVNLTDQGLHCLADQPVQEKLSCVARGTSRLLPIACI